MVKTKIIETTEKYDKDGKLVEKVAREENIEDNTDYETKLTDKNPICKCKSEAIEEDIRRFINTCKRRKIYADLYF